MPDIYTTNPAGTDGGYRTVRKAPDGNIIDVNTGEVRLPVNQQPQG